MGFDCDNLNCHDGKCESSEERSRRLREEAEDADRDRSGWGISARTGFAVAAGVAEDADRDRSKWGISARTAFAVTAGLAVVIAGTYLVLRDDGGSAEPASTTAAVATEVLTYCGQTTALAENFTTQADTLDGATLTAQIAAAAAFQPVDPDRFSSADLATAQSCTDDLVLVALALPAGDAVVVPEGTSGPEPADPTGGGTPTPPPTTAFTPPTTTTFTPPTTAFTPPPTTCPPSVCP